LNLTDKDIKLKEKHNKEKKELKDHNKKNSKDMAILKGSNQPSQNKK